MERHALGPEMCGSRRESEATPSNVNSVAACSPLRRGRRPQRPGRCGSPAGPCLPRPSGPRPPPPHCHRPSARPCAPAEPGSRNPLHPAYPAARVDLRSHLEKRPVLTPRLNPAAPNCILSFVSAVHYSFRALTTVLTLWALSVPCRWAGTLSVK